MLDPSDRRPLQMSLPRRLRPFGAMALAVVLAAFASIPAAMDSADVGRSVVDDAVELTDATDSTSSTDSGRTADRGSSAGEASRASVVIAEVLDEADVVLPPTAEPAVPTLGVALREYRPLEVTRRPLTTAPVCDDGRSGPRIEVLYVHGASQPSTYDANVDVIREAMVFSDSLVDESVPGREFHLRLAHRGPPSCVIEVQPVVVPDDVASSLNRIIDHLMLQPGFQRPDRKYLFFAEVDDGAECGLAASYDDDSPGGGNLNNGFIATHAGVGKACWDVPYDRTDPNAVAPVHEIFHMLGSVNSSAPNATINGHCTDESDLMCYTDGPGVVMRYLDECGGPPSPSPNFNNNPDNYLLDCNDDDYFDPSRPTSGYLREFWNTANSDFLYGNEGDRFVPLPSPVRAYDSRIDGIDLSGDGLPDVVGRLGPFEVPLPLSISPDNPQGAGNPKATIPWHATAVVLNVTAIDATEQLNITVWPTRLGKPLASNLNVAPGTVVANQVTVKLGNAGTRFASGSVSLSTNRGFVDVAVDVVGYYTKAPAGSAASMTTVVPYRVLDSRVGTGGVVGAWGAGETRSVRVVGTGGVGGVPVSASAVVLNVTAANGTASRSHLRVFPSGQALPGASSLNFEAGRNVPNLVTVGVGGGGSIDIYNHAGSVDVVADVVGFYDSVGGVFVPIPNERILDSRPGSKVGSPVTWGADETQFLQVTGVAAIPVDATGVVLNVTGVGASERTNVRVFPSDAPGVPLASNLNVAPGPPRPNAVVVGLGADGRVGIFNDNGSVDLVADVVGYFLPAAGV